MRFRRHVNSCKCVRNWKRKLKLSAIWQLHNTHNEMCFHGCFVYRRVEATSSQIFSLWPKGVWARARCFYISNISWYNMSSDHRWSLTSWTRVKKTSDWSGEHENEREDDYQYKSLITKWNSFLCDYERDGHVIFNYP